MASNSEQISGSATLPWERSIRGRLHLLMNEREARRLRERDGLRRFSRGEAIALLLFGLIQTGLMLATFLASVHHG